MMNRQQQVFLTMGVLIVLIIGMYVFSDWFSKVTGYFTGADEKIKLIVLRVVRIFALFLRGILMESLSMGLRA